MKNLMYAYCNECDEVVEYKVCEEDVVEEFKGEQILYRFSVGRCNICGSEVATDIDYNTRKSKAKIEAYKRKIGIIDLKSIEEILKKYDVGKESLADIAGFGKVTIKRYFEGYIPSKEYSDILLRILEDEEFFWKMVQKNKSKLKEITYKKIRLQYDRLSEIKNSKIDQIVNYIIIKMGEITPLSLQKLLSFSNGVNYSLNGKQLIFENSQAWAHGPVYPQIYSKYKKYGYKPIDNGIYSTHGGMLSKLTREELKAIDLVIHTFGLYSPKILEAISHMQDPWLEKRIGYKDNETGKKVIDENSIRNYYTKNNLNSEETIMSYIATCIKKTSCY